MKKLLSNAALALSFALPMSAMSTIAAADPHYWVTRGTGPGADGKVEIRSRAHGEGHLKCLIASNNYLIRNHEQNWSRWIHVEWDLNPAFMNTPGVSFEWHYKDARGKWCQIWNRRGWIDKSDPDLRVLLGNPENPELMRPVPNTWTPPPKIIFTTGRWGNDVPVFRDRDSYFNARENGRVENVVCRLKKGMNVQFTPYRDWGVGNVVRDNCKGWIDKGVIR